MLSASAQNMALNHIPLLKIFDLHNLAGLGYQKYQVACMHQHNTLLVPFLFLGFLNNILLALTCYQEEQLVCTTHLLCPCLHSHLVVLSGEGC